MQHKVIDTTDVVIRFAGDSGDGMQLTGSLFADMSAIYGNALSTFPDFPAEIRAPHGTVSGVSGFQVHIGSEDVNTPGDYCDLLVAMNPAALKANAKWLKRTAMVILDSGTFDEKEVRDFLAKRYGIVLPQTPNKEQKRVADALYAGDGWPTDAWEKARERCKKLQAERRAQGKKEIPMTNALIAAMAKAVIFEGVK